MQNCHIGSDIAQISSILSLIFTPGILLKPELSSTHLGKIGLYQIWALHHRVTTGSSLSITDSTNVRWKAANDTPTLERNSVLNDLFSIIKVAV